MFICFEGVDGAGKSTQARMLLQHLVADGYSAELVADPGTTQIGVAIRQLLLTNDNPITSVAQMLLFSAARAELANYIASLPKKTIVVCDRWILSTLVYQGVINGIDETLIRSVFAATKCQLPDICFLLDLSPTSARKRMGAPRDRYERKSLSDRKKMRQAYLDFARGDYAHETHIVNAERSVEATHRHAYKFVCRMAQQAGIKPKKPEQLNVSYRRSKTATR